MRLDLQPHPALPSAAVRRIEVEVARARPDRLDLRYIVSGDITRVRLPEPAAPERTDELWKHTCFEAFLRPGPGPAYVELNFSPSTEWAAYAFDGERVGMRPATLLRPPGIAALTHDDRFELRAGLDLALTGSPLAGLTAVIEDIDGAKSYWALFHPAAKPDFHHPGGFTLELPAVE